jgi:2-aminoethylphosphonate-pyruvate transaminase
MLRDWGSRDQAFIDLTAELTARLLTVAHGEGNHVAVPLQGSGTFIVEAAIATLVRPDDSLLVLSNGAYGERMIAIARRLGRRVEALRWPEDRPVNPISLDQALFSDRSITHVAVVHCETTSGLLNPLGEIAQVVARHGRALLVDAMSSFGALPLDAEAMVLTSVMASGNKCLESVPGVAFAVIAKQALLAARHNCPSLSFDLYDQWRAFEASGQWRFTPPVQVVAALVSALRRLEAEGGPTVRCERYYRNFKILDDGMRELGFRAFLQPTVQSPIIATFRQPTERWFNFSRFYRSLATKGFVIYPGKLTTAATFRIGCIGAIEAAHFVGLLRSVETVMAELRDGRRTPGEEPRARYHLAPSMAA